MGGISKLEELFIKLSEATRRLKVANLLTAKGQAIECADLTLETINQLIVDFEYESNLGGIYREELKSQAERIERMTLRIRELESRQGINHG